MNTTHRPQNIFAVQFQLFALKPNIFLANVKATHPLPGAIFNEGVKGYNDHKNQLLGG
jgi:hypothetical protein